MIIVCADADARCPTIFLGMREHLNWKLDAPAAFEGSDEAKLTKFREVRDPLDELIRAWLTVHGIPIEESLTQTPNQR